MILREYVVYPETTQELFLDLKYNRDIEREVFSLHCGQFRISNINKKMAFINCAIFEVLDHFNINNRKVREKFIFNDAFVQGVWENYMNKVVRILSEDLAKDTLELNLIAFNINNITFMLSLAADGRHSFNHSLIDYCWEYINNPKFSDIIDNSTVPGYYDIENQSVFEVQEKLSPKKTKNEEENKRKQKPQDFGIVKDLSKSGVKLNNKQLNAFIYSTGVMPNHIDSSYISDNFITESVLNGIRNFETITQNDNIDRLVALSLKKGITDAGYKTKIILVLLSILRINDYDGSKTDDCGSVSYIDFTVQSEDQLKGFLYGKNYLDEHYNKLKTITADSKTIDPKTGETVSLVGRTIKLRSALTCNLKDGVKCETCVGKQSKYLQNTPFSVYSIATPLADLIAGLLQQIISSKHFVQGFALGDEILEYDGVQYRLDHLMSSTGSPLPISKVAYNVLHFKEGVTIHKKSEAEIIIDGKSLKAFRADFELSGKLFDDKFTMLEDNKVKVQIRNESPKFTIDKLLSLIETDSSLGIHKELEAIPTMNGKVNHLYNYFVSMIDLKHSLNVELLICALTRDLDNNMITANSETLRYFSCKSLITKPDYMKSMSDTIQLGYFNDNMSTLGKFPFKASSVPFLSLKPRDKEAGKLKYNIKDMFFDKK